MKRVPFTLENSVITEKKLCNFFLHINSFQKFYSICALYDAFCVENYYNFLFCNFYSLIVKITILSVNTFFDTLRVKTKLPNIV